MAHSAPLDELSSAPAEADIGSERSLSPLAWLVPVALLGVAAGWATLDLAVIMPSWPASTAPVLAALSALGAWRASMIDAPKLSVDGVIGLLLVWAALAGLIGLTSSAPLFGVLTAGSFAVTGWVGWRIGRLSQAQLGLWRGVSPGHSVAVIAAAALATHAVGALVLAFISDHDQAETRLSLAELEPNHLAALIALVIAIWVLWVLERLGRDTSSRWLISVLIAVGISMFALVLTGSRTAPMAMLAAIVAGLLVARRWWLIVGGAVIFVLSAVVVTTTSLASKIVELTGRSSVELTNVRGGNGRTMLWRGILEEIQTRPWWGTGLGPDRFDVIRINEELGPTWVPQHTHNLVLHVLLSTGFMGAAILGGAVALLGWRAWRHHRLYAGAVLMFIAVDGVSEAVLRMPSLSWVLLSVGAGHVAVGRFAPRHVTDPEANVDGAAIADRGDGDDRDDAASDSTALTSTEFTSTALRGAVTGEISMPWDRRSMTPIVTKTMMTAAALLGVASAIVWAEPGNIIHRVRCANATPWSDDGALFAPKSYRSTASDAAVELGSGRQLFCGVNRHQGLTMVADVAVSDLNAGGPGRIVEAADGIGWNDIDVMIGQENRDLIVRVRTGQYRRDEHRVEGVFSDHDPHELRVVISHDEIRVWRDGIAMGEPMPVRPIEFDRWHRDWSVRIGNTDQGERPFLGTIDELVLYAGT